MLGDGYLLGGQVKDVENRLEAHHQVLKKDLKDDQRDIKNVQRDIRGLLVHQVEQEVRKAAVMEKYMKGCGK